MQEEDVKQTLKNFWGNKTFISSLLTGLFSVLIALLIGAGIVWHYRANIFGYFAKEYLQEAQGGGGNTAAGTANPIDQQAIFSQQSLVVNAVKKTNPAVVSILISKNVPKYEACTNPDQQNLQNPFGDMFPNFPNLFFNVPQYCQNGTQKQDIGGGSGFFVSSDGLIVTNRHVVDQKDVEYTVFTNDGKKHSATVVALDPVLDIALIKISGSGFPYLSLGNSDNLEVGQSVIAIGNALGEYHNTVSVGVVSGLARSITASDSSGNSEALDHVIQTDAAINPGNSGGPLLDLNGEVVGVNVAIAEGSQNVGFALPINSVKGAIESVENTGKIIRPYLGVRYVMVDEAMKEKNNLSVSYGALVQAGSSPDELAVIPGSPADKAGIVENDIILSIDGVKLDSNNNLASVIRDKNVGQTISLQILHKGTEKTVSLTLTTAPQS